jgi:hypothetical protein
MEKDANRDGTHELQLASWSALEENVSRFRDDCAGFQQQLQGLYNEIELLYRAMRAQCLGTDQHQHQVEQRLQEIHQQNEGLRTEVRQLRELFHAQVDQVAELAK